MNRHFIEHRRAAASLAHSMTTGAWGDLTETLRPGTAAPLGPAGGGKIQGAAPVRRPSTTGSMGRYEAQKQLEGWIEDDMDVRCFCNVCFLCFFYCWWWGGDGIFVDVGAFGEFV